MRYFPDVSDFNIDTTAGKAQYLAHSDLEPVEFLIEHNEATLNGTINHLGSEIRKYDENHMMRESAECSNMQMIMASRVCSLSYQSVLLIIVSLLEEAFKCWCRILAQTDVSIQSFNAYQNHHKGADLETAFGYIQTNSTTKGITDDALWEKITAIRAARNAIVHCGGRVPEAKRELLKKYKIGMREEDFSVYIDAETIKDIFNSVMTFMDRIFNKGIKDEIEE